MDTGVIVIIILSVTLVASVLISFLISWSLFMKLKKYTRVVEVIKPHEKVTLSNQELETIINQILTLDSKTIKNLETYLEQRLVENIIKAKEEAELIIDAARDKVDIEDKIETEQNKLFLLEISKKIIKKFLSQNNTDLESLNKKFVDKAIKDYKNEQL